MQRDRGPPGGVSSRLDSRAPPGRLLPGRFVTPCPIAPYAPPLREDRIEEGLPCPMTNHEDRPALPRALHACLLGLVLALFVGLRLNGLAAVCLDGDESFSFLAAARVSVGKPVT